MNSQSDKTPKLLNIKQLAEKLVVGRTTIHYWLKHDRCPVAPVVGMKPPKWRVSDVDAFLTARGEADAQ